MFFISLRINKRKLLTFAGAVLAVIISAAVVPCFSVKQTSNNSDLNLSAQNESERKAFLSQFGIVVSDEPNEVIEVIIPSEFNDVYNNYNEIQKAQGFELSDYRGKRVKRWTYKVLNYPGYEDSDTIYVNVLIYKGEVIGGDICNIELDGFMHGFALPKSQSDETEFNGFNSKVE